MLSRDIQHFEVETNTSLERSSTGVRKLEPLNEQGDNQVLQHLLVRDCQVLRPASASKRSRTASICTPFVGRVSSVVTGCSVVAGVMTVPPPVVARSVVWTFSAVVALCVDVSLVVESVD
jgi:hypothetical protein